LSVALGGQEADPLDTWCKHFFDVASTWWPRPAVGTTDQDRLALLRHVVGPPPKKVLELGSGSGTTAVVASSAGYQVQGVEISQTRIAYALELAEAARDQCVHPPSFIESDFYSAQLAAEFDVVTYWNGFGVGSDGDQRSLLSRISREWLVPGGYLIMDVYAPWRWSRIAGNRYEFGDLICENSFDPAGSRFVEKWSRRQEPNHPVTQYGRCYAPADFLLLVAGLGLSVVEFRLDGKILTVDEDAWQLLPLLEAWQYTAILRRGTPSEAEGFPASAYDRRSRT
jgi:SAM-dependent methyltransferase